MIEVKIKNIEELFNFFRNCSNSHAFRGHLSSEWKIESSLVRSTLNIDKSTYYELEDTACSDFKSKFNIYGDPKDKPESKLGWLSMMQHYGAPTRLIDFSTSPYVALCFIIENLSPYSLKDNINFSIYSLNYSRLNEIFLDELKKRDEYMEYNLEKMNLNAEKVSDIILEGYDNSTPMFMMNEPIVSNRRIDRQNGTFLITNIFENIEVELSAEKYKKIDFKKIIIPSSLYCDIFNLLRGMNISLKNIYGDLDGLGKSIKSNLLYYSYLRASGIGQNQIQM